MSLFPPTIETERLVFKRLSSDTVDLQKLFHICSADPAINQITRYMPWDPHQTLHETQEFVEWCESGWDNCDQAAYVIRPADGEDGAGQIAGITRLECEWERQSAMFELWLRKRFWGRGYSSERAAVLMGLAFERLDLDLIHVNHEDGNERSKMAIRKYVKAHGGQYDGLLKNWGPRDRKVVDAHRYTVTQRQYREATT
ncbi:GNAT family N-acetyltransferase [Saliphagus infecundisoli]|uniref:GNAT family N-acetyltransferase n=1 Tax=Saliphagus infecundisoli TaxID=1849069 RepID=A0ABD5QCC3_9EURY|nr:GNAT family protein [Saliphagus infecundisoli]